MSRDLPLGPPHHVAYVVDDIPATVARLVEHVGAGPFFVLEDVPLEDVTSRGEAAVFAHTSAFGACGDAVIELIQPARLAPARVKTRFGGARPRVHHIAYVVAEWEVDEVRGALDERGVAEYLSSRLGEPVTTLHDGGALLGHDLEIHADNEGLHGFFGMVAAAAKGWDGAQPLRPVAL